jgi:hypothetical protein
MQTRITLFAALLLAFAHTVTAAPPEEVRGDTTVLAVAQHEEIVAMESTSPATVSLDVPATAPERVAQRATVCRVVRYCIAPGQYRPADVVNDWGANGGTEHPNLLVKVDGSNDQRYREMAEIEAAGLEERFPGLKNPVSVGQTTQEGVSVEVFENHDLLSRTRWAAPSPDECSRFVAWRTSVPYGDKPGQWSWPPRV